MLLLFETPAGHALFKIADGKVAKTDEKDIGQLLGSAEKASSLVQLQAFSQFEDTAAAVAAASDTVESRLGKGLKKFLSKHILKKNVSESLGVVDSKLGSAIKEKLNIQCVWDRKVLELTRSVRTHQEALLTALPAEDLKAIQLGLAHSLSRYKLKFSPDKVDTMIVQAIGLLDELDKEINTYAMRVREWYGWHFPELVKIVPDNLQYAKCVLKMGIRTGARSADFSDVFEDESVTAALKETSEVSMGTEISESDVLNIKSLAEQVVSMAEYRAQLSEYLKNRMNAIAPNLTVRPPPARPALPARVTAARARRASTSENLSDVALLPASRRCQVMVGELVGARLIAHAGSLMNLAKHPASTVQILGAEKALFRALKTKHDTPKYGLIYHASLVGQTAPKHKGRISRVLAAKTALAIRVDAIGEAEGATIAYENRQKVEDRIRALDSSWAGAPAAAANGAPTKYAKTESNGAVASTAPAMEGVGSEKSEKKKKKGEKKRKLDES